MSQSRCRVEKSVWFEKEFNSKTRKRSKGNLVKRGKRNELIEKKSEF